jgi:hypothetical protein
MNVRKPKAELALLELMQAGPAAAVPHYGRFCSIPDFPHGQRPALATLRSKVGRTRLLGRPLLGLTASCEKRN